MCGSGHQNMIRLQCIIKRLSPITCSPGNLTKIFLHVQLYTVCTSQDFDRITQHAPISTWLCRFTDVFPQSRSCLTRFQQSGRFKVEYCDGKILTGELQLFKHMWLQTQVVCTCQHNCVCYHLRSRRMKLPNAFLSPTTDEKLLLDQKWRITVEGPVMPHTVRC